MNDFNVIAKFILTYCFWCERNQEISARIEIIRIFLYLYTANSGKLINSDQSLMNGFNIDTCMLRFGRLMMTVHDELSRFESVNAQML